MLYNARRLQENTIDMKLKHIPSKMSPTIMLNMPVGMHVIMHVLQVRRLILNGNEWSTLLGIRTNRNHML